MLTLPAQQLPGLRRPAGHHVLRPFHRDGIRRVHCHPTPPRRCRRQARPAHRGERKEDPPRVHARAILQGCAQFGQGASPLPSLSLSRFSIPPHIGLRTMLTCLCSSVPNCNCIGGRGDHLRPDTDRDRMGLCGGYSWVRCSDAVDVMVSHVLVCSQNEPGLHYLEL